MAGTSFKREKNVGEQNSKDAIRKFASSHQQEFSKPFSANLSLLLGV